MLIRNYGLFWRRDLIYFGRGSNAGHLKGTRVGALTSDPIDFRDQQGVYCLYDDNFRLVYVGQAGGKNNQRLFHRLKQHRKDALSARWSKFSWFGILQTTKNGLGAEKKSVQPKVGEVLNHIEAILIAAAEPVQNRQGGRFGKKVIEFLQWKDEQNLAPTTDKTAKEILSRLKAMER
jgi:hypothetical protein